MTRTPPTADLELRAELEMDVPAALPDALRNRQEVALSEESLASRVALLAELERSTTSLRAGLAECYPTELQALRDPFAEHSAREAPESAAASRSDLAGHALCEGTVVTRTVVARVGPEILDRSFLQEDDALHAAVYSEHHARPIRLYETAAQRQADAGEEAAGPEAHLSMWLAEAQAEFQAAHAPPAPRPRRRPEDPQRSLEAELRALQTHQELARHLEDLDAYGSGTQESAEEAPRPRAIEAELWADQSRLEAEGRTRPASALLHGEGSAAEGSAWTQGDLDALAREVLSERAQSPDAVLTLGRIAVLQTPTAAEMDTLHTHQLPGEPDAGPVVIQGPGLREETQCTICCDAFMPRDEIRELPCRHNFHRACIDRWLRSGRRGSSRCPVCKACWRWSPGPAFVRLGDATMAD